MKSNKQRRAELRFKKWKRAFKPFGRRRPNPPAKEQRLHRVHSVERRSFLHAANIDVFTVPHGRRGQLFASDGQRMTIDFKWENSQ